MDEEGPALPWRALESSAAAPADSARVPRDPLVLGLFAATLLAALQTLGRAIVPALDEGVYLTAARLMVHDGLLPFRDFSLAHPPFTMLLAGLVLEAVGGDLVLFDALYTAFCLSAVFPIARTVRAATGDRRAALVAALLFLTFPELLRWDARFLALRQAGLPFLAFGLEALWVRKRPVVAGVLLGLFGAGLVPHALLAVIVGAAAAWGLAREGEGVAARRLAVGLGATLALAYGGTALLPGFWDSAFGFQVARERVPLAARLGRLAFDVLPESGPILLAGLAGSFLLPKPLRALAWLNLAGLPVILLLPQSFYPHYLSSFGPSLAIAAGGLVAALGARRGRAGPVTAAVLAGTALLASGLALREPLTRTTPHLFRVVEALRRAPEPVLCLEPVYAHWAGRRMTFHYNVADLRYAPKLGFTKLDAAAFADLVARSGSVLVDPNLVAFLTPERTALLKRDFLPVFRDARNVLLVRRSGGSPGARGGEPRGGRSGGAPGPAAPPGRRATSSAPGPTPPSRGGRPA